MRWIRSGRELGERGLTVDVLINNAGFGAFASLHEADAMQIAQQVRLNVAALTDLTCTLLPLEERIQVGAMIESGS